MHTKKLLVLKDVAYGVREGAAVGTPLSQNSGGARYENTADGGLAIILEGTDGKPLLVCDAGASGAGQVNAAASLRNSKINFVQGVTGASPIVTGGIPVSAITGVRRKTYAAPVKPRYAIGFNGTSGSLNLPSPITLNMTADIVAIKKVQKENNLNYRYRYNITTAAAETAYSILNRIAREANNTNGTQLNPNVIVADILADGARTAFTGTPGTLTLTKGSVTGVFASAIPNGLALNDFVAIQRNHVTNNVDAAATVANSLVYQVIEVSGNNITLDRPYTGETQTISQVNLLAGWIAGIAAPTVVGLHVVANNIFEEVKVGVSGILENATITTLVGYSAGTGHNRLMAAYEEDLLYYRNFVSQRFETALKKGVRFVPSTGNFTTIEVAFSQHTSFEFNQTTNQGTFTIIVPTGGSNANAANFTNRLRDIFTNFGIPVSGF
jgi:hypothetical protein